jgi:hypothetical protein
MIKKVLVIAVLLLMVFNSTSAFAQSAGTVLTDMVYGAAIGALLGAAFYVFDEENLGEKVVYGAAIGTMGGFLFGLYDSQSMSIVNIEDDKVTLKAPVLSIEEKVDSLDRETHIVYSTNILSYRY